jgi:hypothetical protein
VAHSFVVEAPSVDEAPGVMRSVVHSDVATSLTLQTAKAVAKGLPIAGG